MVFKKRLVLFLAQQLAVGHGLLIHKIYRSHRTAHQSHGTSESVGLLWTSGHLVAETSEEVIGRNIWTLDSKIKRRTDKLT